MPNVMMWTLQHVNLLAKEQKNWGWRTMNLNCFCNFHQVNVIFLLDVKFLTIFAKSQGRVCATSHQLINCFHWSSSHVTRLLSWLMAANSSLCRETFMSETPLNVNTKVVVYFDKLIYWSLPTPKPVFSSQVPQLLEQTSHLPVITDDTLYL